VTRKKIVLARIVLRIVKYVVTLVFLAPFYVAFAYSMKNPEEVTFTGLAFPTKFRLSNFTIAIEMTNFFQALANTVIVTAIGTVLLTVVSSMAGYSLARRKGKYYIIFYGMLVATLLIPFQTYMLPLYIMLKNMQLTNTLLGFTLAKIGAQVGFTIIIITGFVKTIPRDLEEATFIDGGGVLRTFWSIIFPLMQPIIFTSIVISALSIWNEFTIAVIILQKKAVAILPLLQYHFFGQYRVELNLAFALFLLSMIPIIALYLFLQKYIISGITMGAVKG
jgi:raffinose/stachyose/melibiose transport system permease protein